MLPYVLGELVGSLIAVAVLTSLLWATAKRWPPSYGKAIYVNLVAFALGVMLRAIGDADEGPPRVVESFVVLFIPQVLVFIAFLISAHTFIRRAKLKLEPGALAS